MGNVMPLIVAGPLLAFGLWWMYRAGKVGGAGLYFLGAAVVVGWFMLNWFGLYQNAAMKQQMSWRLGESLKDLPSRRYFVGVASPNFRGMIDPHEDVGYLLIYKDRIDYYGESMRASFRRSEVRGFETRPNIHSAIFMGGWVVIRAERDGKPLELRIEMREKPFLRSNRALNRMLLRRLKSWLEG